MAKPKNSSDKEAKKARIRLGEIMAAFNVLVLTVLIAAWSIAVHQANAEDLDQASQQALEQTKQLLKNPSERSEAVKKDKKSEAADVVVDQISGNNPQMKNGIYDLATEVFERLTRESGGDATKMQELVKQYTRNPSAFAEGWTPEQKAKLKELSNSANPTAKAKN